MCGVVVNAVDASMRRDEYGRAVGLEHLSHNTVFAEIIHHEWHMDGAFLSYTSSATSAAAQHTWIVDLRTGTKHSISSSPITPSLPVLSPHSIQCSGNSSIDTKITFVNDLDEELRLFWIDWEGKRKQYHVIKCGEIYTQHTYASHAWMVTTLRDQLPICAFIATNIPSIAPIRDARDLVPTQDAGDSITTSSNLPSTQWRVETRESNICLRHTYIPKKVLTLGALRTNNAHYSEDEIYWSPNGEKLVAMQTLDPSYERYIHFVETSPEDQVEPKLHTLKYSKPGDPLPDKCPHLYDLKTGKQIHIPEDIFANAYTLSEPKWEFNSERFFIVYNQRGHQLLQVVAINSSSGHAKVIVEERSTTFIDYAGKYFIHFLEKTREIIWMSERDGWNHLYLYDSKTGKVKNQITQGKWVVRGVEKVDEEMRQIFFKASGIYAEQDPYYIHYCHISFDGTGYIGLTRSNGTHTVEFSPCFQFYLDTYSRVDQPPITELHRTRDGSLVTLLEVADISALHAINWRVPLQFVAKGRDGCTDIYGVIFRPTNFDGSKKYPIVEEIYAGPQDSHVPKAFSPYFKAQSLAELGFIVVIIDGMGTSNRSKAFHNVCAKNLGDAGLPDRILWIQTAAKKYPFMDIGRVGIWGVSAGGQNALRALLLYPEFYKVGVSASACHDNRMDKLWWNELWMGWPVGPHYELQSNVTQAHLLQGKLLLIVCEMDTNVDPASTYQVVNALIKADKDFDLVVIPGEGHGLGGAYGERKMWDFFVRHLLESGVMDTAKDVQSKLKLI